MEELLAYDKDGLIITTHQTVLNGRKIGDGQGTGVRVEHKEADPGFIARRRSLWQVVLYHFEEFKGQTYIDRREAAGLKNRVLESDLREKSTTFQVLHRDLTQEDAEARCAEIKSAIYKIDKAWGDEVSRQKAEKQDSVRALKKL